MAHGVLLTHAVVTSLLESIGAALLVVSCNKAIHFVVCIYKRNLRYSMVWMMASVDLEERWPIARCCKDRHNNSLRFKSMALPAFVIREKLMMQPAGTDQSGEASSSSSDSPRRQGHQVQIQICFGSSVPVAAAGA
ncbi:hypothetical protein C2845_PM13G22210 [Panicum miliaceum]|uniref:Uncharacterized protein n=1 Tax=Panicum miliaceum TaxID=4540 RepID=A0A3L6RIL7_PANMI|nr:hypothetical protein C2845_PM13G22210 [Panicum miliaceum]